MCMYMYIYILLSIYIYTSQSYFVSKLPGDLSVCLFLVLVSMATMSFSQIRNVHDKLHKSNHPKAKQLLEQLTNMMNEKIPAFALCTQYLFAFRTAVRYWRSTDFFLTRDPADSSLVSAPRCC